MEPDPTEVSPWYLRNINQALALDELTGNVYLRTGINGDVVITGNVNIPGNVEISNDVGNPVPVTGNITTSYPATASDAFGRLRVSNPYTLFDTRSLNYDHDQFATDLTGTASATYEADSSSFLLSVLLNGDTVVRETYKTFIYQPGKSLFVLNSFVGNTPTNNVIQRIGYFNDDNGVFFEVYENDLNLVIRSSSSGSIVENRIPQTSWNGDRLNGLGGAANPSGLTLNPAVLQIFWLDIEWLGAGSVRTGFMINGEYITCHTFEHANISGNTTTYMGTAVLPCRYEITTSGTQATLRQICSTVISEGGYQISGEIKTAAHTFGQERTLPNNSSYLPLISIRLKSTMLDSVVIPANYSVSVSSNDLYIYRIYRRAVTTGGTWVSGGADSAVEYNLSPTNLVSGVLNEQGYIRSSNQTAASPTLEELSFDNQLLSDPFTNTAYEFVITCATNGTNQDAYASISWQDIS